MRVFVTGATGFIGSAVVQELLRAGHQVIGLARSDAAAESLAAAGAQVQRGSLEDLESLRSGVAASDGVIHAAFNHDFSNFLENCKVEALAVETIGAALLGSNRPMIVTSGVAFLGQGNIVTEETPAIDSTVFPRGIITEVVAKLLAQGVNISIARMPPTVHGDGDHGLIPTFIKLAREKGVSPYVGEGLNHWPAVHRLDAAHLYRLVLEKGTKGGIYHAIAEEGVPFRDIAEAIGRGLKLPVVSKSEEEAAGHFAWYARLAAMNVRASSQHSQEVLGWRPTEVGLIADLDKGTYFS